MRYIVKGGKPLSGAIEVSGAKNAATKMMVASLLTEEPVMLKNFPAIGDTAITRELCELIGSKISLRGSELTIETPEIKENNIMALSRKNRIPILVMGPLLLRSGAAEVPFLGGDKIGGRPVDLHIEALRLLGAEIETTDSGYRASARDGLRGAVINLKFPSVGATENVLIASVLARGKTILKNAALEPEVIDLVKMLQTMGAKIEIAPERTVHIEGVPRLHAATYAVMPDRNEAVSFACLAMATGGDILVKRAVREHLTAFSEVIAGQMGAGYEILREGIRFFGNKSIRPVIIETSPHPGFMTDWQQPLSVVLTQADGTSSIHETIYENRFDYTGDLIAMGARVKIFSDCGGFPPCRFANGNFRHRAEISGPTRLYGGRFFVHDLRSGMANMIAALSADGESEIENAEEIERGYERLDERLRALGAEIKSV